MWRNIIILSLLILLPLGGYSIYWWVTAGTLKEAVQKNLDDSVMRLSAAGLAFAYDDLRAVGYPSLPVVKLSSPSLTREEGGVRMSVSAEELIIEPERGLSMFRILIPNAVTAAYSSAASTGSYAVKVDFVPKLTVRTAAAYTAESKEKSPIKLPFKSPAAPPPENFPEDMIYEYAINMPKGMMMHVTKDGRSADIAFQWPLLPYRVWQPMRYDLARPYDLFFNFLQEVEERM